MGAVFSTRGTILVANEHTSKVVSISYDMVSFSRRYVLIDLTLRDQSPFAAKDINDYYGAGGTDFRMIS